MNLTNTIMWFLTLILLLGFVMTYKNLDGKHVIFDTKYEGLIVSTIALVMSVYVGVKSSKGGIESFMNLYY